MDDHLRYPANVPEARELADLQSQMQRSARRINLDGSFELGWGTAVLVGSLGSLFASALPKWVWGSPWLSWVGWLPMAGMCLAPYAVPKLVKRLITWPRIGYSSNPHDLKFWELVKYTLLGLAIGAAIVSLFELISQTQQGISSAIARGAGKHLTWEALKFLICASFAVFLARKVTIKRPLVPSAYVAPILFDRLKQTSDGKTLMHGMKLGMALSFIAILLVLGGLVLGVIWLVKSMTLPVGWDWHQSGLLIVLVASNALLYLMLNAATIKTYKWKCILLAVMFIAPILAHAGIPSPTNQIPEALFGIRPPVLTAIGLVWFLSGAATLIVFMRHNPLPQEPAA